MTDELLIKFLLKESSGAENLEVQEWRSASDANEQYFAQFEKLWEAAKALKPNAEPDENAAWMRFKEKTLTAIPREAIVKPLKPSAAWIRVAAVLVLTIGAWAGYSLFAAGYTDLDTEKQVITQSLPDGSELTLNKNSRLSYARNFKNRRSIKFKKGDVFFKVAKDMRKPFIIDIEDIAVEVVGTSFNIKHIKDQTEVTVESGIVKVSLRDKAINLYKGEKIVLNSESGELVKEPVTDQLYNYYRTKLFVAANMPLWKLVSTLNEAYGGSIILDPKVKDLTINTTLKQGSLEMNLQIICETLNLKQSRNGREILLSY